MTDKDSDPKVIGTREELRFLINARRRAKFQVDIAGLPPGENEALERELREAIDACGCAEAAAGLMLGLLAGLILWWTVPGVRLAFLIALPVVAIIVGKAFGQWRGRRELRRLIKRHAP